MGAGGGSDDSVNRIGTMRKAAGTGVGVSTAVRAARGAGDVARSVGLASGVGAVHAVITAASATVTNAPAFTEVLPTGPLPPEPPPAQ